MTASGRKKKVPAAKKASTKGKRKAAAAAIVEPVIEEIEEKDVAAQTDLTPSEGSGSGPKRQRVDAATEMAPTWDKFKEPAVDPNLSHRESWN